MKKKLILISSLILVMSLLCGCEAFEEVDSPKTTKEKAKLSVSTTWSGKNRASQDYQKFIKAFSTTTGVEIIDSSDTADENYKQRIITDFQVGAEPDVMFYFTGTDADNLVKANKLVSIEEIKQVYPDFANNIADEMFQPSEVDGKSYSVPMYGYWEALYVNTKVCEDVGIPIPDENTTWEEFLDMCEKIKKAGYVPIAASIASEPHYLFEYMVYNHSVNGTQSRLPVSKGDLAYDAWTEAFEELRDMYQAGYFSDQTLYCDDNTSFSEFLDGKAAFSINGSWMIATIIQEKKSKYANYAVTYVPGTAARKSTDVIGGFSSGWYISRKAWDDPEKREAAVELVEYMTQTSIIENFASMTLGSTSLKDKAQYRDTSYSRAQNTAAAMLDNKTSMVPAVQDKLDSRVRSPLMDSISDIVSGKVPIQIVLDQFLENQKGLK